MRNILCTVIVFMALFSGIVWAQTPSTVYNRYGHALLEEDGKTTTKDEAASAKLCSCDLNVIPAWYEPYTYTPDKIKPEDYKRCTILRDEVYKTYPDYDCRMDVYLPKGQGTGTFPYIMFIHGGGWKNGDKRSHATQAAYFASHGIASISVDYTLCAKGNFPVTRQDLLDAKAYIEKNAKEWHIDTKRFGFSGHSAGGHLSAYMAMTVSGTKVLIGSAGPQDLPACLSYIVEAKRPELVAYFELEKGMDVLKSYSPYYLIPNNPPATMLLHGTLDKTVFCSESVNFEKALREKGAETELILSPYAPHSVINKRAATYEEYMIRMLEFAKKHLK